MFINHNYYEIVASGHALCDVVPMVTTVFGYDSRNRSGAMEDQTTLKVVRTISLCALLTTCQQATILIEQVVTEGELRVVTRSGPTTYYLCAEGHVGPEFDLVKSFAY